MVPFFVRNDSSNSLTWFESIQTSFESYQSPYGVFESFQLSLDICNARRNYLIILMSLSVYLYMNYVIYERYMIYM
jgi:hypothetical protein